jgi:D-amino peptidase
MKVFISSDMEGATGVTGWDDVRPGKAPFERFRRLLTGDVNAAIKGAFEAGADEVLVNEAHDGMRNILIEELDKRATMISGFRGKRLAMMEGVDESFDAAFLVAYHARAGTDAAILNHTFFTSIHNFWIDGVLVGETGLSATLAGHYGVPVVLVTGDDKVSREAKELLGTVETAVVKEGISRYSANCLPPDQSSARIREAAKRALSLNIDPYQPKKPVKLAIEFQSPDMAAFASSVPGVVREGPRTISYTAEDVLATWNVVFPSMMLATTAEQRS